MRVRSLTAVLLSSVMAVAIVGCAGDEPVEPSDTAIELPTPSDTATTTEPTDEVLDLESMTDEELLAEAERTYQNWLDDVEEMRAEGGEDYLSLDEWTTADYRATMQRIFGEDLPPGTTVEGVQGILGLELVEEQPDDPNLLDSYICLDNTTTSFTDEDGKSIKRPDAPKTAAGIVQFEVSPDRSKLLIAKETSIDEVDPDLCA